MTIAARRQRPDDFFVGAVRFLVGLGRLKSGRSIDLSEALPAI